MEYIILVLQAPLVAYGDEAVDQIRRTDTFPGKSMLTGLIGNALGYRRPDGGKLQNFQESVIYAARTEPLIDTLNPSTVYDFHTAQLKKSDKAWTTYGVPEGRKGGGKSYDAPELRYVDYLAECRSVVALTLMGNANLSTDRIAMALQNPARPIYIGRKCCIPERPIYQAVVESDSPTEALYSIRPPDSATKARIQWDGDEQHHSVHKTEERWVSDLKDWKNNIHTGRRLVNRGVQQFPERGGLGCPNST